MASKGTIFITTLLFSIIMMPPVQSQDREGQYIHIDYLMIEPENEQRFLDHISRTFVPIQRARKDNQKITNWYLYRVSYPGTQNSFYNYVVITLSDSISGFEDVTDQLNGQFTRRNRQQMTTEYKKLLSPNHSELWRIRNSVINENEFQPSRYIVMNYMNVGLGLEYEYQMFEDEVARPLHELRMERDKMYGWELNELITPGGLDYGYNFSTMDYFKKLEHIEFGFTTELIRQTHPDTNINEFFSNIYRTRDLVRSEVWELIQKLE
jgi:hypothetical protein